MAEPPEVIGHLSLLTDPGKPSLPYFIVRVLLPEGHEFAGFDASPSFNSLVSESYDPRISEALRESRCTHF